MTARAYNFSGKIVVICGPTASGKSQYAIDLARQNNGIIINADSMQVYRHLPILTAQPGLEDMAQCPHRLYSIIEPDAQFSVAMWLELVLHEIEEVVKEGKVPIIVGGTGMYISSLINGLARIPLVAADVLAKVELQAADLGDEALWALLAQCDEAAARRIKVGDRRRAIRAIAVYQSTGRLLSAWQSQTVPYYPRSRFYIIGIMPARQVVYQRCDVRFLSMLATGAIDEVRYLLTHYPGARYPKVLGLPEICAYLDGEISEAEMISKAQQYTRNYAKRQFTWFRNQIRDYDLVVEAGA